MFLSENSRPAWILHTLAERDAKPLVWVPTVEDMLEDGLLMLAFSLKGNKGPGEAVPCGDRVRNCYDLGDNARKDLYGRCRSLDWKGTKLVITVLSGSTIEGQLHALGGYPLQTEVCRSRDAAPRPRGLS